MPESSRHLPSKSECHTMKRCVFFYNSTTFQLLEDGVADMHCRSDLYLVDELKLE